MTQKQDPHVSNNYKYNIFTLKKQIKKSIHINGYGIAREFSRTKPINSASWTYLLQVHSIIAYDRNVRTNTRGLATFKLETLTPNDYSGLTQTPRNLI